MINLLKADLYALLKRCVPWVLLILMLVFMGITLNSDYSGVQKYFEDHPYFSYSDYLAAKDQLAEGETEINLSYRLYDEEKQEYHTIKMHMTDSMFEDDMLPDSMMGGLAYMNIANILLVFLAASTIGNEYKSGIVRQSIASGVTRFAYLGSKFLTLIITALGFIAVAMVLVFVVGIAMTILVTGGMDWGFLGLGFIGSLFWAAGIIFLLLFFYMSLAFIFSILFKSSAVGVIAGVMLLTVESTFVSTLAIGSPPGWLAYTAGYNNQYLWAYVTHNSAGQEVLSQSLTTCGQSVTLLAIYTVLTIAVGFIVFRRQNLGS